MYGSYWQKITSPKYFVAVPYNRYILSVYLIVHSEGEKVFKDLVLSEVKYGGRSVPEAARLCFREAVFLLTLLLLTPTRVPAPGIGE